jgi:hypothetical protein
VCAGHQGYKKAEVTGGGVSLEEVKWETLESSVDANRGLFFCGEVLDCFGRIGGFNFYWAWYADPCAPIALSPLLCGWSLPYPHTARTLRGCAPGSREGWRA